MITNRITYLSNSRFPSEMANTVQIMNMCHAMAEYGFKVNLLKPYRVNQISGASTNLFEFYNLSNRFDINTVKFIDLSILEKFIPSLMFRGLNYINNMLWENYLVNYYIKNYNKDLIYMRHTLPFAIHKISKLNIPAIVEFHAMPSKRYIKYYKDAFKNSRKFIPLAITKLLAEDISKVLDIDFNDILILPSAVNIDKFSANKIVSRNDEKKLNITYVGSLIPNRGVDILITAAKVLKEINFTIIGGVGEDLSKIKSYKEKNDLKNVNLLGFKSQKDLPLYYQKADILILPMTGKEVHTTKYASPSKLFEYMASGKPIIASDLISIREILKNNESILLFEPDNSKDLINKIKLLSSDPDLMIKLSKNSKNLAKKYSWNNRVEKIQKHIQKFNID